MAQKKIEVDDLGFVSADFYHENYFLMFRIVNKGECSVHLTKDERQIFSAVINESEIWFAVNFIQAIMKNDFAEKSLKELYRFVN